MISVRLIWKSKITGSLVISGLVFFAMFGLRTTGTLEPLELSAYDFLIGLKPDTSAWDPRIVLIRINEDDIRKLGQWPISDKTLTKALKILTQCKPRAIGVDIYRDIPVPPGREKLNEILKSNRNIIMVMKFNKEGTGIIPPPAVVEKTEQVGFSNIIVDPDGNVRRVLLFLDDGVNIFYSFSLRLALLYLRHEGITPQPGVPNPQHIRLGKATIPPLEPNDGAYVDADTGGYQFLWDFSGAQEEIRSYSLKRLLAGEMDPDIIKDKIILIGVVAESVKDLFYIASNTGFGVDRKISGTELHGHMTSQLLRFGLNGERPISTQSEMSENLWILLWCFLGGLAGLRVQSTIRFALIAGFGIVVLGFTAFFSLLNGHWISVITPASAWLASASIVVAHVLNQEKRQRASLMQLFSRHVSEEVAEAMWQQRDKFLDGGRPRSQKLIASVMFTDLIGFTSISERSDPKILMDWLNEYMEAMAEEIRKHQGIINKYIGDAILALFGFPLARETDDEIKMDAINAVRCSIAMNRRLIQLNRHWKERDLPVTGMRTGIFTGPLVAGSLGSSKRLEYTVIGDTVNIAARLESFDKGSFIPDLDKNPCRILVGESTARLLSSDFMIDCVGEVSIKGKAEKIRIYHIDLDD